MVSPISAVCKAYVRYVMCTLNFQVENGEAFGVFLGQKPANMLQCCEIMVNPL